MKPATPRLRRLSDTEIASYEHLDPALARRVRVAKIPLLPGRYLGMTLGPLVLMQSCEPDDGTSALLAHELVHVRQWREQGTVGFAANYLRSFATGWWQCRRWHEAYRNIPAEVEARAEASKWAEQRRCLPDTDAST
ncbi:MAG: hypothetical protein R2733_03130 [Acidimicrobiales bacterium]